MPPADKRSADKRPSDKRLASLRWDWTRKPMPAEMEHRKWERMPGEHAHAFAAFQGYLSLPLGMRSYDAAFRESPGHLAKVAAGLPTGRRVSHSKQIQAPSRWQYWASVWRWQERAAAWDDHVARIEMTRREAEAEARAVQWADRRSAVLDQEWTRAEEIGRKLDAMLKLPVVRQTVTREEPDGTKHITIEPADWRLADVARLLDTYSKVARLATGLETDRLKQGELDATNRPNQVADAPDYSQLPPEALEKVVDLYAEINAIVASYGVAGSEAGAEPEEL